MLKHTQLLPNYGALTTTSLGEGAKRASWHLQLLATAPGLQRRGLARALIGEVEKLVILVHLLHPVPNKASSYPA
jgi:GNAT superfamily N-acetyltransferase